MTKDRRVTHFRVNDVSTPRMVNTGDSAGDDPVHGRVAVILTRQARPSYRTGGGVAGDQHPANDLRPDRTASRRGAPSCVRNRGGPDVSGLRRAWADFAC